MTVSAMQSVQQAAQASFDAVQMASPNVDEWKNVDFSAFTSQSFTTEALPTQAESAFPAVAGYQLKLGATLLPELPEGVVLSYLSAMSQADQETMASSLLNGLDGANALELHNTANFSDILVLQLDETVKLDQPLVVRIPSMADRSTQLFPRLAIRASASATATVILIMEDQSSTSVVLNSQLDVELDESAELTLAMVCQDDASTIRFNQVRGQLAAKAQFDLSVLTTGGQLTRHDIQLEMLGEGAHADMAGISVLTGESQVHVHTRVTHHVAETTSDQLFKNVLTDSARSEYNGLVHVCPKAQLVESSQSNQNLLLSDNARAFSRPQLEIYADDVKCAHGATIGQLNDQEVFYLQSRGLSLSEARSVLLTGFVKEVVETFPSDDIQEILSTWVTQTLPTLNGF